jgi:hypothetical protein
MIKMIKMIKNKLQIEDFMSIKLTDSEIVNISEHFSQYHNTNVDKSLLVVYSKILIKFKDYDSLEEFLDEDIYENVHCSNYDDEKCEIYLYADSSECYENIIDIIYDRDYDVDIYQFKVENNQTDFFEYLDYIEENEYVHPLENFDLN